MKIFSALLVTGGVPSQMPVTWSFDIFFHDLHLNKWLSNNEDAGDLRYYHAHYDVIVMRNKSALVKFMAWFQKGNKPLPEPMMT